MDKFTYSLTFDDYLAFENFKVKRSRSSLFSYIICLFFIATGVYNAVAYKVYEVLVIVALFVLAIALSTIYSVKIGPKKRVKQYINCDPAFLGKKEITVGEKTIEIRNIPAENQATVLAIYPYSLMAAIYETNEGYYFFVAGEAKLLPKKAIPDNLKEIVAKRINNNPNHIFVK
jgi:hypothetical protein